MGKLDLSLYLVTDSTSNILGSKDLVRTVEDAIKGGVTIVQYREKNNDSRYMIETARALHEVTKKYGIPLLINDRVDVALAAGVEGVHLGADDMSAKTAKNMLPPGSIIGITACNVEEAEQAVADGADYIGVGTVFATPTKTDTKSIIGTQGVQEILTRVEAGTQHSVGSVAIGGINLSNVQRVLHQSAAGPNRLNGVAIVSAIMGADDPQSATQSISDRIKSAESKFYASVPPGVTLCCSIPDLLEQVPTIIKKHAISSVLCHNMTNTVVQNFAANVCLATGSSPIMSMNGQEAPDLAKLGGALVINMGTVTPDIIKVYLAGIQAYNAAGNPILFDPVGGGATSVRRAAIRTLMSGGFFDVIKGNEGEICAVAGSSAVQQRGVDSGPSTSTPEEKAKMVKQLAMKERCVVIMSGATDYVSDGERVVAVSNGSHWLGRITGSGCALGSVIAGYVAVHREDKFLATLAGMLHYEIAAERAEQKSQCQGPGSFIPAFLDELYIVGKTMVDGGDAFASRQPRLSWM